jgi:charged multivesicular body protein 4
MLEREVYSIETANINKETLEALKKATNAIKRIHGGLTVDKVDQTMEQLREQVSKSKAICDYSYLTLSLACYR